MFRKLSAAKLLLLYLFLSRTSNSLEDKNESIDEETLEETTIETEFSLGLTTTTEATTVAETSRKLSVVDERNISTDFRPSVHLGEIKESRISTSPFNNVHHISFENGIDPNAFHEHLKDFRFVFEPTELPKSVPESDYPRNFHQSFYETESSEESRKETTEENSYVKFQDDANIPRIPYETVLQAQPIQFVQSIPEHSGAQYDVLDQQVFQNLEKPVYQQETFDFYGKPTKLQTEDQRHKLGSYAGSNMLSSPYFGGFHGQQSYSPPVQQFEATKKPNNGMVYVQESAFMRTRKFPYPFYQPPVGYHELQFVHNRPDYNFRKRVSPWKKILHLIGAFLPLGLLLATITPNVLKIDNSTQPNIVLSKLRVADLPVEHKEARLVSEESWNTCEERSICEMILVGGKAGSSVLQNALWHLATRTSTIIAKENELQEIFEAVKKKDCSKITC